MIDLPNDQILSEGITVDATNSVFTIDKEGVYYVAYSIGVEQNDPCVYFYINGMGYFPSANIARPYYSNQFLVRLPADANISLGIVGPTTEFSCYDGVMNLTVFRIAD